MGQTSLPLLPWPSPGEMCLEGDLASCILPSPLCPAESVKELSVFLPAHVEMCDVATPHSNRTSVFYLGEQERKRGEKERDGEKGERTAMVEDRNMNKKQGKTETI